MSLHMVVDLINITIVGADALVKRKGKNIVLSLQMAPYVKVIY